MKCFTLKATRQQFAILLAWCRQSEIVPYDYAGGGEYTPVDISKLIDWYVSFASASTSNYNIYVDDVEYMLLAVRWPQLHQQISPSSERA